MRHSTPFQRSPENDPETLSLPNKNKDKIKLYCTFRCVARYVSDVFGKARMRPSASFQRAPEYVRRKIRNTRSPAFSEHIVACWIRLTRATCLRCHSWGKCCARTQQKQASLAMCDQEGRARSRNPRHDPTASSESAFSPGRCRKSVFEKFGRSSSSAFADRFQEVVENVDMGDDYISLKDQVGKIHTAVQNRTLHGKIR